MREYDELLELDIEENEKSLRYLFNVDASRNILRTSIVKIVPDVPASTYHPWHWRVQEGDWC